MKKYSVLFTLLCTLSCGAQTKKQMETKNNPLLCDPQKGICEIPDADSVSDYIKTETTKKPLKIIYFTDPICSSCWGIEPQLRKLKLEYGNDVEVEYRMGGLLPDWSYNSGGISKPSDVAHHWDEVSKYYNMPIDGDIWLEDPLDSSFPPSIAFKAAQLQDEKKAIIFLRTIREMVFLEKKNICKWENIEIAAKDVGLNVVQLKNDFENEALKFFQSDLELAKKMGVRGFPSLFISNADGKQEFVYGFKAYSVFEDALKKMYTNVKKQQYKKDWGSLFLVYPTLTLREFSELSEINLEQSEKMLNELTEKNFLTKKTTKNGNIWSLKQD